MVGNREALRVSTCVPICEIGNDGSYGNGFLTQGAGTSGAVYSAVCDVTPYNLSSVVTAGSGSTAVGTTVGSWISPHLPLMALAFDRYRMESVEFIYEPQAAATTDDRLVFAWTDDPAHPFLSAPGINLVTALVPSQLNQLVTKDSVAFMPWKQWSLRVPVARDERFMYDTSPLDDSKYPAIDTGTARLYSFGSMSCRASAAPASAKTYGVLYCRIVIDLFDPVPIVQSVNTLVDAMHSFRISHKKAMSRPARSLVEKKVTITPADDEDFNVPPPAFAGAPSETPSGIRNTRLVISSTPSSTVSTALAPAAPKGRSGWL